MVDAIVLAAGEGNRFKSKIPKPLAALNSKPLLIYSLEIFGKHPLIGGIILAVNPKNSAGIKSALKKYRIKKIKSIVLGGRRRQDSVFNALKELGGKSEMVLVHDACRPFIDKNMVTALIRQAKKTGAAIAGVPVKATIKAVGRRPSVVTRTLNRDNLREIQTPQVFRKDLILKAYNKFAGIDATDDSTLVEKLGQKVSVVEGSYNNIKVTTPEDLVMARAILKAFSLNS